MIKTTIIAEIGCNHMGNMQIACDMVKNAANFCMVDAVKFQKRTPLELLTTQEYNSPHPNPEYSYGLTYGQHREFLELNREQHNELKLLSDSLNIGYSSSVWDISAARDIISIKPTFIKIPSASNLNFPLLDYVADNFSGEIHVSFGMTTPDEEEKIIKFFQTKGRNKDLVIYSCVSGYPVAFQDLSLLDIERLKNKFGKIVKAIGFSGHHLGIAADIAALTLGATYFERHFTLDRTWKGTDHAASLEPDGMRKLTRDIRNVSQSLTYKSKYILDIEEAQRKKLKRIKYE